jgi:hypothetical protein
MGQDEQKLNSFDNFHRNPKPTLVEIRPALSEMKHAKRWTDKTSPVFISYKEHIRTMHTVLGPIAQLIKSVFQENNYPTNSTNRS